EAARLLGWSRGAVKWRLERGRALLRARLRRRGLELSTGLCMVALAWNSASAPVSAKLAHRTLPAALTASQGKLAGVVSAQVAALVAGASTTMFHGKAKIATVLLVAASLVAVALGVVRHRAVAEQAPPAQSRAEKPKAPPKPAAEATIELSGKVLSPE